MKSFLLHDSRLFRLDTYLHITHISIDNMGLQQCYKAILTVFLAFIFLCFLKTVNAHVSISYVSQYLYKYHIQIQYRKQLILQNGHRITLKNELGNSRTGRNIS